MVSRGSTVSAWKLPAVAMPRLESAKMRPMVSMLTPVLRLNWLEDRSATAAPLEASNSMPRLPPRSVKKSAPLARTSLTSKGVRGRCPRQRIARIRFALRVAVSGQLHRGGVAEDQVRSQGRLGQQRPYHSWREIVEHHRDDASAPRVPIDHMVPGVERCVIGVREVPAI